jgi:hypothetical protein
MPAGTIGFEVISEVDDDWERAVEPVLRHEIADRRTPTAFDRVAVVSDEDCVRYCGQFVPVREIVAHH